MKNRYRHTEQYCNNKEVEFKGTPTSLEAASSQAAKANAEAFLLQEDYGFGAGVHEVQLAPKSEETESGWTGYTD